jgi:glycosyltransferase involved in cell wall biosynthesis
MFLGSSKELPHKGLEVLTQAFRQTSDTKGVLIVFSSFSQQAERLAAEGLAHQRIFLMGKVTDAPDWLCHADLYAQPSLRNEGLPRSIKEAMAIALPIIITKIPGHTELIEHEKSGLFVPANNPRELAQAWQRVAGGAELRQTLGNNARALLIEHFSSKAFLYNTLTGYYDLLKIDSNI